MTDYEIIKSTLDKFRSIRVGCSKNLVLSTIAHASEIFYDDEQQEYLANTIRALGNTMLKPLDSDQIASTIKSRMGWVDGFLSGCAKEKARNLLDYVAENWTKYVMNKGEYYLITALGQLVVVYNTLEPAKLVLRDTISPSVEEEVDHILTSAPYQFNCVKYATTYSYVSGPLGKCTVTYRDDSVEVSTREGAFTTCIKRNSKYGTPESIVYYILEAMEYSHGQALEQFMSDVSASMKLLVKEVKEQYPFSKTASVSDYLFELINDQTRVSVVIHPELIGLTVSGPSNKENFDLKNYRGNIRALVEEVKETIRIMFSNGAYQANGATAEKINLEEEVETLKTVIDMMLDTQTEILKLLKNKEDA